MNEKTSVLLVGNFFTENGSRQVCQDLAEHLNASGWQVFTTSSRIPRFQRMIDMLYTVWRLRNTYQVVHIDVFSGPSFLWAEAVANLLLWLKKPFALTLRGGNLPAFSRQQPKRVERVLNKASVVTVPSAYLLHEMQQYCSSPIVVSNPIELSNYSFQVRLLPKSQLVWLRAFASLYNPSLAAEVVALLQDEFPDIHLTMIGPDKGDGTFQQFQAKAEQLGVSSRVSLPGRIPKPDVPHFLQASDIFLNTTNIDNAPVSVIEAMAGGLCVVSTNVGGISYLLEHEHDALLVPPENAQAMANAVRRILTEPGLAERLSRNARAKAECFDWVNILPQWETLLCDVIERHRSG